MDLIKLCLFNDSFFLICHWFINSKFHFSSKTNLISIIFNLNRRHSPISNLIIVHSLISLLFLFLVRCLKISRIVFTSLRRRQMALRSRQLITQRLYTCSLKVFDLVFAKFSWRHLYNLKMIPHNMASFKFN